MSCLLLLQMSIQTSGPGLLRTRGWWSWLRSALLSQRVLMAQLGLGWWQHSSTALLLSPGWSCHFRHCTNPTEVPLGCGARALLCRTLAMYRVCLELTWLEWTKTTRSQYSKLGRASLLSTGHIRSFPSESLYGISCCLPQEGVPDKKLGTGS